MTIWHPDTQVDYVMHYLTCSGNEALVTSDRAAGAEGVVTGELAPLPVDFEADVLERLAVDYRVTIKTHSRVMRLLDCPDVWFKEVGTEAH